MNTEHAPDPWETLTHELRADVAGPVTAATLAAFVVIVPDHAVVEISRQYDGTNHTGHLLVATWDHDPADDVVRSDRHGFDIAHDVRARPADYALTPVPGPGNRRAGSTQLEGAEPYTGPERRAATCGQAPGCYLQPGHDGDHRLPTWSTLPGRGTRPAHCTADHDGRPCIRPADHDSAHVYAMPAAGE